MPKPKYTKFSKNIYSYEKDGKTYYAGRLVMKEPKYDTFVSKDSHGNLITDPIYVPSAVEHKKKLVLAKNRFRQGDTTYVEPDDSRTFAELYKMVFAVIIREGSTKIRYGRIYQNHFDKYIEKTTGKKLVDIPTKNITYGMLNDFLNFMQSFEYAQLNNRNEPYKKTYIVAFYKLFKLVYHESGVNNYITKELADELEKYTFPNINRVASEEELKIRSLSDDELIKVNDFLKENYPNMYLPFLISVCTGARTGEAFAARFSDFRIEDGIKYFRISHQMVYRDFKGFLYRSPKTFARDVPITDELWNAVQERKAFMDERKKADQELKKQVSKRELENGWLSPMEKNRTVVYVDDADNVGIIIDDFISTDENGKYLYYTGSFKKPAREIRKSIVKDKVGYENFSFYSFRKTFLTNMANEFVPPQYLARLAGHKKIQTLYEKYYSETAQAKNDFTKKSSAMAQLLK